VSLTWFKIPIAEFLKETRRMSLEAKGAYVSILCDYYENGPMPGEALVNIIGLPEIDAEPVWKEIEPLFTFGADKRWHHARADKDLADREALRTRSVVNGQKGGRKPRSAAATIEAALAHVVGDRKPLTFSEVETDGDDAPDLTSAPRVETTTQYIGAPPPPAPDPQTAEVDEDEDEDLPFAPIPEDFFLSAAEIGRCMHAGASSQEVAQWFDEWKNGHLSRGTLAADWLEAWQKRFEGKMAAKPPKAKPRIEVSRRA